MNPFDLLRRASTKLKKKKVEFAVAGGLAGNFFRQEPRLTKDVDLLLMAESLDASEEKAVECVKSLGLSPGLAKTSDLRRLPGMNKKNSPVVMVVGRKPNEEKAGGLDILLPRMIWVPRAIERARNHTIDFGFAKLPTITLEDWIVAKAFALRDNPTRFKDMDDLQSVFESPQPIDFIYLCAEFERHNLSLPKELEKLSPKPLRRISKKQRNR